MDPVTTPITDDNVEFEYLPFIRTYKDGRVERLLPCPKVPPSVDPTTGVSSKDVVFLQDSGVSARIFLPKLSDVPPGKKLPVVIYFHGGYMCFESPFSATYHGFLTALVSQANVVAVSVDYRLAPEHPLPAAYEDSYAALQWVASHAGGEGSEPWLTDHADFGRLFLGGDSAGANICHNLAMRAGSEGLVGGVEIEGLALVDSYFWGTKPVRSEAGVPEEKRAKMESMWAFICPSSPGNDDARLNPTAEHAPSLAGLGCRRVLVSVAAKDFLKERAWVYYEKLRGSGWAGKVEIVEIEGEDHVFHLFKPSCDKTSERIKHLAAFFNQ